MHLITPFKCMLTLALHLPCNWRPQNGTMNKAERAERTPVMQPKLPSESGRSTPFRQLSVLFIHDLMRMAVVCILSLELSS